MHRTVKSILRALCRGHPLRWPKLLQDVQVVMNQAVHTTTGQQPFFAFFNRYAPRRVEATLPEVPGTSEGLTFAQELLKTTHLNMARKFRATANRYRRNEKVNEGALVWVKAETLLPGASSKLQTRWLGPYRVTECIRNGSAYRLKNVFSEAEIQRAADKVKPYVGEEHWLTQSQEVVVPEYVEPDPIPPRVRRPPRRLIQEM